MQSSTKKNLLFAVMYAVVLAVGIFLGQNFADEKKDTGNNPLLPLGLTDKQG